MTEKLPVEFPPKLLPISDEYKAKWTQYLTPERVSEVRLELESTELRVSAAAALALQMVSRRAADQSGRVVSGTYNFDKTDYVNPVVFSLAVAEQTAQVLDQIDEFVSSGETIDNITPFEEALYLAEAHFLENLYKDTGVARAE